MPRGHTLIGLVVVVACGLARAEPASPSTATQWQAQADELLRQAQAEHDAAPRFKLADDALHVCEKAAIERPQDPVPLILAAEALSTADPARPEVCRPGACEKAVTFLKRARELDRRNGQAGAEARRIADALALVYSRLNDHAAALEEYRRALEAVDSVRELNYFDETGGVERIYGNAAETLMALGRLDEAIRYYQKSLELSQHRGMAWELANWGLGLALDRDEQPEAARAAIRRALDLDPAMNRLSADAVFFEPPGDKWAYVALGHEVAGDREQAISAWRAFLQAAPSSPFAARARAHLDQLRRGLGDNGDLARLQVAFGTLQRGGVGRPLEELRRTLSSYTDDVRLCYARALRKQPKLRGELVLKLEIHPVGVTTGGTLQPPHVSAAFDAPDLTACVESAAAHWRFRPIESPLPDTIAVTVELAPGP